MPIPLGAFLFLDSLGNKTCTVYYYRIEGLCEDEGNNKMMQHGHTTG